MRKTIISIFLALAVSSPLLAVAEPCLRIANRYAEHDGFIKSYHNSQVSNDVKSKNVSEVSREEMLKQCAYEIICKIRVSHMVREQTGYNHEVWLSDFWINFSDPKNTEIILIKNMDYSKQFKTIKENDNTISIVPNIIRS